MPVIVERARGALVVRRCATRSIRNCGRLRNRWTHAGNTHRTQKFRRSDNLRATEQAKGFASCYITTALTRRRS